MTDIQINLTNRPGMTRICLQISAESRFHRDCVDGLSNFVTGSSSPPDEVVRAYQDTASDECANLVKKWISECENHDVCNSAKPILPTRVLRVDYISGCLRLVETNGQTGRYVALSHCWGRFPALTTTLDTLESRKRGIEFSQLGKTFQDAVILTRKLEFCYLWIDALCIIQDSTSDWERESGQMASVYRNSQMTIAASRAASREIGCFSTINSTPYLWTGDNSSDIELKSQPVLERVAHPHLWDPWPIDPEPDDSSKSGKAVFWMALQPSHDMFSFGTVSDAIGIECLPLLSRAWALQERVLSPRILHFGPMELFWECRNGIFCECPTEGLKGARDTSAQEFYSALTSPLTTDEAYT
jgi:hypothetical protein